MKTDTQKNGFLFLLFVLVVLLYFPINHLNASHNLAISLDRNIPLVVAFAIPYLVFLPAYYGTVIYAWVKKRNFARLIIASILAYAISEIIYILFSTYVTRPTHSVGLISLIYAHDRPICDFPSLHNATAVIFGLYWVQNKNRWLAGLPIAFSLIVVASTLLTRQHTIVGMLGGLSVGLLSWKLAPTIAKKLNLPIQ